MDLHDTPLVSKEKKLQPGTVLTIEPGEVVTSSCGNQTSFYTLTNCIVKYNQRERERESCSRYLYTHVYVTYKINQKEKEMSNSSIFCGNILFGCYPQHKHVNDFTLSQCIVSINLIYTIFINLLCLILNKNCSVYFRFIFATRVHPRKSFFIQRNSCEIRRKHFGDRKRPN